MTEERLHAAIAQYIKLQYPKVIFNSDLSGIKLTKGQAGKVSVLRSSRAFPDVVIYESRRGFAALFIELKRQGVKIYKLDGALVADKHIKEQAEMLKALAVRGYCARFAVGFDEVKSVVDWYFKED
jgi:hypothetical protein